MHSSSIRRADSDEDKTFVAAAPITQLCDPNHRTAGVDTNTSQVSLR